jgi:hypothetical protein
MGGATKRVPGRTAAGSERGSEVIAPLVVTDFNGDDHQDALVGDGEYVRILLGDGEGHPRTRQCRSSPCTR